MIRQQDRPIIQKENSMAEDKTGDGGAKIGLGQIGSPFPPYREPIPECFLTPDYETEDRVRALLGLPLRSEVGEESRSEGEEHA